MLNGSNENSSSNSTGEKTSYCLNTMARIATMKKAIIQTEQLVNKTKESVEIELKKLLEHSEVAAELQRLKIRVKMLREQVDREQNEVEELKKKSLQLSEQINMKRNLVEKLRSVNIGSGLKDKDKVSKSTNNQSQNMIQHDVANSSSSRPSNNLPCSSNNISSINLPAQSLPVSSSSKYSATNLSNLTSLPSNSSNNSCTTTHLPNTKDQFEMLTQIDLDDMKNLNQRLIKSENEIQSKGKLLSEINESLRFSERKLITELYEIFPIKESQETGTYTILNLPLPDLNEQLDENDVHVKISLGYCCQLLMTISKVFDIPLRHKILFSGSQSWIFNDTENPKLKEKKYPLFPSRDKAKFNIAMQLFNENVVQLRHHFDLPTPDPKKLSANLYTLFRDKLLLREENDKADTDS